MPISNIRSDRSFDVLRGHTPQNDAGTDPDSGSSARQVLFKLGAFFRIGLPEELHPANKPLCGLKLGPL
ncbi:hypothetical protein BKI51_10370 [Alphaproteobacteria bacterium AO1-B]|nr:hypothetical protein BKI51_10370 [Alphaproteobacteria bacterium AO1-B]